MKEKRRGRKKDETKKREERKKQEERKKTLAHRSRVVAGNTSRTSWLIVLCATKKVLRSVSVKKKISFEKELLSLFSFFFSLFHTSLRQSEGERY